MRRQRQRRVDETARVGLMRSAEHDTKVAGRMRDRTPHDSLHLSAKSGFCYCLCPHCWAWLVRPTRGVCLCMDCPCGGATWYHELLAVKGTA